MRDNERKESISALRQLVAMCDFVDQYGDSIDADPYFNAVETAIESLNETRWIPVSERLPEDTTKPVLISGKHKGLGVYAADIARYNGGMWQYDGFTFPDCDILAWMPLPEPYREDGEA